MGSKKRSTAPSCPDRNSQGRDWKALGMRGVKLQVWISLFCSLCNYFFTQLTLINLPQASTHRTRMNTGLSGPC